MAREAKLGLVFIGILLTVFSALLIKRLTKHSNLPPLDLSAAATKAADPAPAARMPPQPPASTVVTPQDDNSRPPEYAMNSGDSFRQNGSSVWGNTAPSVKTELPSRDLVPSAPPPSLLTEPIPVANAGSRYNTHPSDESSSRAQIEANHLTRDDSPPVETPVPYRSGYSAVNDDTHSTPTVTVGQPQSAPVVDPFQRANSTDTPPPADYATGRGLPNSNGPGNSSTASGITTAGNLTGNSLRSLPVTVATTASSSSRWAAGATDSDRYSPPPPARGPSQIPVATSDFTPHVVPTNEYLPRNTTASDFQPRPAATTEFTSRDTTAGIMPNTPVPGGIQRNGDQYSVQPNDSFWTISEKAYGVGGYFKALFELNRKRTKDSEDLKVGEVLTVPDEAVIRRMYPDLCPKPRKQTAGLQQRMAAANSRLQGAGRVYTVVEGDTLFEIARHELGKPARWGEIYELNREALGDDFDYLRPGTQLILPDRPNNAADLHGNTATRQPDAFYSR